jgi:ligand-binding sensor domain-containing protein/signal transduction histidine kinase
MKKILSLILLFIPHLLFSQKFPIKVYKTTDGLASSFVNSVMCDSRGFVWFSTRNGLSRFDGERFVTYGQGDGLTDAAVYRMNEIQGGTYWVALNNGTTCRFLSDSNRFSFQSSSAIMKPMFEEFILQVDSETYGVGAVYRNFLGELYVGGSGSFLVWDSSLKKFHRVKLPPKYNFPVSTIVKDKEGSVWLGTSNGIVRYLPSGKFVYYSVAPQAPTDWIYSLYVDHSGRLWIGHGFEGVFVLKPEPASEVQEKHRWQFERVVVNKNSGSSLKLMLRDKPGSGNQILIGSSKTKITGTSIVETSDGRIWLSTSEGLLVLDGNRFLALTSKNGFPDCVPAELSEDKFGNLWVASTSGAIKIALHGMTRFEPSDGIGGAVIYSLYNDQHGRFVAVSGDWNLNYFNGYQFSSYRPRLLSFTGPGWTSKVGFLDRENTWWFLTERGLWRYSTYSNPSEISSQRAVKVYKKADGLPSDYLHSAYEDSKGKVWLGCRGNGEESGLSCLERGTGKIEFLSGREGVPKAFAPQAFCEDSAGNLWIGFYHGGIARYRNGTFKYFSHADGVPENMITSLLVDRRGKLWIGSNQDGIACIEDPQSDVPTFRYYTVTDGLSSNNVRCLATDQWDRLYIGTVRGVDRYEPATGRIKHYTLDDGLPNEFITCALEDLDDNIWFGTQGGIARMKPEPIGTATFPPSIFIGDLRIAGTPLSFSPLGETSIAGLELQHDQTNVQVELFSIGRGLGEVIRYQYLLKGAQDAWSAPTQERTVHFANLSAGNYEFEVRAINSEGMTSSIPARVTFTILRPVTARWWFRVVLALVIISFAYGAYRYRVANLLRLERLRLRIASDLHDDVGSALTKIAIHSEIIQNTGDANKIHSSSQLIGNLSREIIRTFSDIIWSIDIRHDTFGELTARMKSFALDILSPKEIAVEFLLSGIDPSKKVSVELCQNLYLIFKEAINNTAKHSGATHVSISLQRQDHSFSLLIKDNGKGVVEDNSAQGHGLKNMKMRAEQLGGSIRFENKEGFLVAIEIKKV